MSHTVVWEYLAMQEFRRLRGADPIGAKECASAVGALADEPRPPESSPLGGSG